MGRVPKVAALFEKRQKIEREIEKLQKSCKHPTKSIKNVRERLDSTTMVIRYVCDECLLQIGYPNEQETDNFFKE